MKKHIKNFNINSFRGINNLKLNDLKEINIITGNNNSGKTSVLEIINYLGALDSVRNLAYSTTRDIRQNPISTFRPFERINYLFPVDDDKNCVHYSFETDQIYDVVLRKENYFELLPESEVRKIQGYRVTKKDNLDEELIDTEHMKLEFIVNGDKIKEVNISEYERINRDERNIKVVKTVYITPFKHAFNDLYLTDVLNDPELYEEMLKVLREFDEDIISINVDSKGHSNLRKKYMILSKNHKKAIPLELYGDGMKKAILLMSAVITAKNGVLLLDEFETAIHTSAMERVFSWILNTSMKLNVQLFITSHSKEAIEKILKCCPELENNINLYTLYRKNNSSLVRKLSCGEAIEALDQFDLELR